MNLHHYYWWSNTITHLIYTILYTLNIINELFIVVYNNASRLFTNDSDMFYRSLGTIQKPPMLSMSPSIKRDPLKYQTTSSVLSM